MIHFVLLFSRHGKVRLKRWFTSYSQREKQKFTVDVVTNLLNRKSEMCNVFEWKDYKFVYKRYASLYFAVCIDPDDNELIVLEQIHRFVEVLDEYFGNVCELDIIFNFEMAYYLVDELFIGGELQESSKKVISTTVKLAEETEKADLLLSALGEAKGAPAIGF